MSKQRFVFLTAAFSIIFTALFLSGIGSETTARSLSIAEKFTAFDGEEVSEEEQMGDYSFDKAHSSINFKIRHMGLVDVPGHFREFDGAIRLDGKNLKDSSVEFTAQMKSVDTGINARDNHLRNKDFFEVDTYPEMTFKSKEIKKKGKTYRVKGDLTIKGVTREVTIPMRMYGPIKDGQDVIRMGITGETAINRRDFNVTYGGILPDGTPTLSDTVTVDLQIESFKKKSDQEVKR
jgi:polyisoprenoid-binding protein YceI